MGTSAKWQGDRVHFLDNLRTCMVFLVVLCHAGWVYESSGLGAIFWIVDDPAVNDVSGLINIVLDVFMMPTLFFISGYLAPLSLRGKSGWRFVRAKFARLMLPWLISVLTLVPLYKVIFLCSRNLPQDRWYSYFHVSNGIISQSWLWFLPVLFLFNIVYLLLLKAKVSVPNVSLRAALAGTFLIGFVYSVGMDLFGFQGWTKIGVLDFQNERLLIYFMAFLLGTRCFKLKVFGARAEGKGLYLIASAGAWVPVMAYVVFLLYPWLNPGEFIVSRVVHSLVLWASYQLSLLCLVYLMIETFRRYQNKQGRLRFALNENSYYVYIVHVVIMGGLASVLLGTGIPSLLKYVVLTIATFVTSNVAVCLFRMVLTTAQRGTCRAATGKADNEVGVTL